MKKIFLIIAISAMNIFSQNNDWQKVNTPPTAILTYFNIDNRGWYWIGTYNGLYKSTDSGSSWIFISEVNSQVNEIIILQSGVVLAVTNNGLCLSDSLGGNFTNSSLAIRSISLVGNTIIGIVVKGSGKDICSSTDDGKSWKYRNIDPYSGDYYFSNICALDTNKFVANTDGRVIISSDGGYHWQEVLKYCCFNPSWYSIDSKNNVYLARVDELIVSKDYGLTWNKISSESIMSLYSNKTNVILISTSNGVNISYDFGSTWHNLGFINNSKSNFVMKEGRLYLCSLEKGLYRYNNLITSVNNEKATNRNELTLVNYPNPFNNSTRITYKINSSSDIVIEIYDSIGRLVDYKKFFNKNIGEYYYDFNSGNLSSGIYLVRMRTFTSNNVLKILLMK